MEERFFGIPSLAATAAPRIQSSAVVASRRDIADKISSGSPSLLGRSPREILYRFSRPVGEGPLQGGWRSRNSRRRRRRSSSSSSSEQ